MNKIYYDIVFYIIIPLAVWNIGRGGIGAYYAMLLSGLSGFIYTAYAILKKRNYSVFGIFILISITISRIGDLLAKSPKGILWNQVFISFAFAAYYLVSVLIKHPMGLYIYTDYAVAQGHQRKESEEFLRKKEWYPYMKLLTFIFAVSVSESAMLKIWFINRYGVAGFNAMSITLGINGYVRVNNNVIISHSSIIKLIIGGKYY